MRLTRQHPVVDRAEDGTRVSAPAEGRGPRAVLEAYVPIVSWLPRYRREWLRHDVVAALSVWALLIPQGIAYASIAGVPAQYGLYAGFGSAIGYALFATAPQVVTGPSAAVAAAQAQDTSRPPTDDPSSSTSS